MTSEEKIFGRRAVLEVLQAKKRKIDSILVARGTRGPTIRTIIEEAERLGVPVREVDRKRLDQVAGAGGAPGRGGSAGASGEDTHQGVVALVSALTDQGLAGVLARAMHRSEPPFLLLVDGVTDPQNLGAMIRTAELTGVHGVIVPQRGSAPLDRATAKASSGAVEHIPICRVGNLAQTIQILRGEQVRVYAADPDPGAEDLYTAPLDGPIGIVVGSEGKGISNGVKERCAGRIRIPMRGKLASLNASVAAAVILFEVMRRRQYGATVPNSMLRG